MDTIRRSFGAVRADMLAWLTAGLGGDALAAEYLLLNLVSRV